MPVTSTRSTTMADLAERHGAWLHVDGAFGLFARLAPESRQLAAGVERANSVIADGHKWLNVPYDCGFAFVRGAERLPRAVQRRRPLPPVTRRPAPQPGLPDARELATGASAGGLGDAARLRPGRAPRDGRAPPGPRTAPRRAGRRGAAARSDSPRCSSTSSASVLAPTAFPRTSLTSSIASSARTCCATGGSSPARLPTRAGSHSAPRSSTGAPVRVTSTLWST